MRAKEPNPAGYLTTLGRAKRNILHALPLAVGATVSAATLSAVGYLAAQPSAPAAKPPTPAMTASGQFAIDANTRNGTETVTVRNTGKVPQTITLQSAWENADHAEDSVPNRFQTEPAKVLPGSPGIAVAGSPVVSLPAPLAPGQSITLRLAESNQAAPAAGYTKVVAVGPKGGKTVQILAWD